MALDLTFIGPGNGTIRFGSGTGARFTRGDLAYLHGTFPVRNAQLNGTPYDTERTNLTLLAFSTNNTLEGTAVRTLRLGDGTPADPAIALDVMPTGLVELDDDSLVSVNPDVIQVLTEAEVGELDPPAGVTSIFPYAFIVRNATNSSTRILPASPARINTLASSTSRSASRCNRTPATIRKACPSHWSRWMIPRRGSHRAFSNRRPPPSSFWNSGQRH